MFKVSIKDVDTVGQLKSVISSRHGHSVLNLLYRGLSLADEHKLAHLIPDLQNMGAPRFSARTKPHIHPKPGEMSLVVSGLEGALFQLYLPPQSTVADLTIVIVNYEAYPSAKDVTITCSGKSLSALDSSLALEKCNVASESLVHVTGKLVGGDQRFPERIYFDREPMPAPEVIKLVKYKPGDSEWKMVRPGLSVRGWCRNRSCAAFRKVVYCGKGFVVFNIAKVVHCPVCKSVVTASSIGFRNCRWVYEGRKVGSKSMDRMSKWLTTSVDKEFEFFNVDKGQNLAEVWNLVSTAKPLPSSQKSEEVNLCDCKDCYEGVFHIPNYVDLPCGHRAPSTCKASACPTCLDSIAP